MSLVTFYQNQSSDHAGRMLGDVWQFDHGELEYNHDFVQWLFPLEVPSPVNPLAPTLDADTIRSFQSDPQLRANLLRSLDLMLNFYGLERGGAQVRRGANFQERNTNWLRQGNHNHLRLTRILHCLKLCGLEGEAKGLLACLLGIAREFPGKVSETTISFWENAV